MNDIVEVFGKEKINIRARNLLSSSLLAEKLKFVEDLEYRLYVHSSNWGESLQNYFTIILTAHGSNIDFFEKSIKSVLSQSTKNIELILVDHGCEQSLKKVIYDYFLHNCKIKLISLNENLNDKWTYTNTRVFNILNSAICCAEGDYVYCLSYDDYLSENYAELMINLFLDNKNCFVASPSIKSVNELSEVNVSRSEYYRNNNVRDKYITGIDLAVSIINNGNLMSAPGGLFAYKVDVVLESGGFDCMNDLTQIFKFAVLGDVGTNLNAVLFWRHHNNQTNKKLTKKGFLAYPIAKEMLLHLKDFYLKHNISSQFQTEFFQYYKNEIKKDTISSLKASISCGLTSAFHVLINILAFCPKVYILYWLRAFLWRIPLILYMSLPEKIHIYYRSLKNSLIKKFI